MLKFRIVAPLALVLALDAGLASGQLLPSQQGAREQDAPASTTEAPIQSGGCYDVVVNLDNSVDWDLIGGVLPDPVVRETTTGISASCNDSFTCGFRIEANSSSIDLVIVDDDTSSGDDSVGAGSCALGKSCQIGRSTVSSGRC